MLTVFVVGGLGSGFINPIIGAVIYERIPAALLGRVTTLTTAVAWSGIPFGGLVGAGLVAVGGVTGALWVVGGCYLVAIVLPGMRPEWALMRRPGADRPSRPPEGQTVSQPTQEDEHGRTQSRIPRSTPNRSR